MLGQVINDLSRNGYKVTAEKWGISVEELQELKDAYEDVTEASVTIQGEYADGDKSLVNNDALLQTLLFRGYRATSLKWGIDEDTLRNIVKALRDSKGLDLEVMD